MKCYYCQNEACAKIGSAKVKPWNIFLGRKFWEKKEIYLCASCLIQTDEKANTLGEWCSCTTKS